jgi:cytochrome c-type biogenesis protein CcmE
MDGSVIRGEGVETVFRVTDGGAEITVTYSGVLPDLFREGQGVIVEGTVGPTGRFDATSVLAKHDENYIPKELRHALPDDGTL